MCLKKKFRHRATDRLTCKNGNTQNEPLDSKSEKPPRTIRPVRLERCMVYGNSGRNAPDPFDPKTKRSAKFSENTAEGPSVV
jgi:hypothetical protein